MSSNYFDRFHSTSYSTTGTGLDSLVDTMATDLGLTGRISDKDLAGGVTAANEMNKIILEAIKKTGSGSDGHFTVEDVKAGVEVGNVDIWGNVGDATDAPFIEVEGSTTANTGLIV